jgi:hypothetical protein
MHRPSTTCPSIALESFTRSHRPTSSRTHFCQRGNFPRGFSHRDRPLHISPFASHFWGERYDHYLCVSAVLLSDYDAKNHPLNARHHRQQLVTGGHHPKINIIAGTFVQAGDCCRNSPAPCRKMTIYCQFYGRVVRSMLR